MAQVVDNGSDGQPVALIETPGNAPPIDILEIADPPRQMKIEMRVATKSPSEWLRLLCRDWAQENDGILSSMDERFLRYKSYLKGRLTSQLLCRLSISGSGGQASPSEMNSNSVDFWKTLGVEDEFDRAHIVANVERFCSLYNIRGVNHDDSVHNDIVMGGTNFVMDQGMPVDSAGATGALYQYHLDQNSKIAKNAKAQQTAMKNEMRRIKAETRERDREEYTQRKAAEKAARDATREERRQRKAAMKKQREDYIERQKEAALQRAAALVESNSIPVEIINRGAVENPPPLPGASFASSPEAPPKRIRSSIVISTATDLDRIVTHSNNLWAKYNAIAKEHNQRVNWVVVAKELGIHVKVREKYARMHSRAVARGFDFVNWGHYRIKDYPQYFTDPLGPTIEATLQANAIGAPGTSHVSPAFAPVAQAFEAPTLNATVGGVVNHHAISLAAEVAAGSAESDVRSDGSAGGGDSDSPLIPGFASEMQYPVGGTNAYNAAYSV